MKGLELGTLHCIYCSEIILIVTVFLDDIKFSLILRRAEKSQLLAGIFFLESIISVFQTADEENAFFYFVLKIQSFLE